MTLVQSYHCKQCNYGFGPIGVGPYMPERPQVFRYCRGCSNGQTLLIEDRAQPLACAHCGSDDLVDVQGKCPVCGSADVEWL
jgi:predicted Zn-ribbon and HTH transcriptional regulator